jgi:putative endonuclease
LDIVTAAAAQQALAMANSRQALGRAAEEAAAAFLRRVGFAIVERNVRFRAGEIDLVCRDDGVVVFVEVKCRRAGWDAAPAAAVSWHKQRRLTQLAQLYLKFRRLADARCRFDVVSVTQTERGALDVRHVRAAFEAVQP